MGRDSKLNQRPPDPAAPVPLAQRHLCRINHSNLGFGVSTIGIIRCHPERAVATEGFRFRKNVDNSRKRLMLEQEILRSFLTQNDLVNITTWTGSFYQ